MNRITICAAVPCLCGFCALLNAQETPAPGAAGAVPEGMRIIPVRVVPDAELGTDIERFASSTNRFLEKRERELSNLVWKIDERTTLSPTAVLVRDINAPELRRVGARLEYLAKASGRGKEDRAVYMLDLHELVQIEEVLTAMIRAARQPDPPKGEAVALHYASRTGFEVSLLMARKGDDIAMSAAIVGTEVNEKDKAVKLFEDCRGMIHSLVAQLTGM
jgi:hypothetical protein